MSKEQLSDEKITKQRKPEPRDQSKERSVHENGPLSMLQQQVGNRAVQRLLAQRSGNGPFELDDDTAGQINQQRGGGSR